MERYRRGKGKRKLLGSHQRCWLWGRHLVLATLEAGRWVPLELHVAATLDAAALDHIRQLAAAQAAPLFIEPPDELTRLAHTAEHQGYLAQMPEYPYADASILAAASAGRAALFLMLDGLQDPFNFGAIVRSAEALGAAAVIIGTAGQVGVTGMVARSSAGAVSRLPIVRCADLAAAAVQLRAAGVAVVGASEKAATPLPAHDFRQPTCVVIGNEGHGIGAALLAECTCMLGIPQPGQIGALNAAAAAAIFCYEAQRQRAGAWGRPA